jgi:hypothetical protein
MVEIAGSEFVDEDDGSERIETFVSPLPGEIHGPTIPGVIGASTARNQR